MEYYLCRAMEACRLDEEQLMKLHVKERNLGRGLNPYEIQDAFRLPTLKEHYGIPPENDSAQANHNQKLRIQFRKANLIPEHGDLSYSAVDLIHKFDRDVRDAQDNLSLDLNFSFGKKGKRNVEEFNDA